MAIARCVLLNQGHTTRDIREGCAKELSTPQLNWLMHEVTMKTRLLSLIISNINRAHALISHTIEMSPAHLYARWDGSSDELKGSRCVNRENRVDFNCDTAHYINDFRHLYAHF